MPIASLPTLDRSDPNFLANLDALFATQLNATIAAMNTEISRINALGFGSYTASSTTSLSIGAGSKSLTVETGKGFTAGQGIIIANTATPGNYLQGQVTSYNGSTGALVVNVTSVAGAGTFSAWSVSVALPNVPVQTMRQRTITATDTLIATDATKLINANGTYILSLTNAAILGDGWYCIVRNTGNGTITLNPNATKLIDGQTTYYLQPGFAVLVTCDGNGFNVLTLKRRTYNAQLITASTTITVPADTYVVRAYGVSAGSAGTATSSGAGGGMSYGDIAVTPGEVITITINAGSFKVTTQTVDRLTGTPASGITPGTAAKHASVTNGGAYSGGPGYAYTQRGGGSSGSPLGPGLASSSAGAGWGANPGTLVGGGVNAANPGFGFDQINAVTDPLLASLTGAPGIDYASATTVNGGQVLAVGGNGGPGAGGGSGTKGGAGGFGGGGGAGYSTTGYQADGGRGGFGGGGGPGGMHGGATNAKGGDGGYGGGGGSGLGTGAGGAGGAPAIILMM